MKTQTVPPEAAGERLDRWLPTQFPGHSRSEIQQWIRAGCVMLAGQPATCSARLRRGATVAVSPPTPAPVELHPQAIPLAILHEDADVIVVNKPAGMVVHPAAGNPDGTLVNALLHHCKDLGGIGGELRPGIVHRLDKDTSGVLVCAKNQAAMNALVDQFKSGAIRKEYLALVRGTPDRRSGSIETLIGRNPSDRKKMSTRVRSGRSALTDYSVAAEGGGYALLRVRIHTGRTHQIRVHMNHLGHPVAGDAQYSRHAAADHAAGIPRQMLHAQRLSFAHPRSRRTLTFEAPLPADMAGVLRKLGISAAGT